MRANATYTWAAAHDVRGYTGEALEVLCSTSTATTGEATIESQAGGFSTEPVAPSTASTLEVMVPHGPENTGVTVSLEIADMRVDSTG